MYYNVDDRKMVCMKKQYIILFVIIIVIVVIILLSLIKTINDNKKIDNMYIYTNEHIPVEDEAKINDIKYDYLIICFDYDSDDEICDKNK